jgi:hypothetical protein
MITTFSIKLSECDGSFVLTATLSDGYLSHLAHDGKGWIFSSNKPIFKFYSQEDAAKALIEYFGFYFGFNIGYNFSDKRFFLFQEPNFLFQEPNNDIVYFNKLTGNFTKQDDGQSNLYFDRFCFDTYVSLLEAFNQKGSWFLKRGCNKINLGKTEVSQVDGLIFKAKEDLYEVSLTKISKTAKLAARNQILKDAQMEVLVLISTGQATQDDAKKVLSLVDFE